MAGARARADLLAALRAEPPSWFADGRSGPTVPVDVTAHLAWVRGIARRVAKSHRIAGWCEIDDIDACGRVELVRKAPEFAPAEGVTDLIGAFRGWAYLGVKKACEREAERILNGGTYHTRQQVKGESLVIVRPRSDHKTPAGDQIEEVSHRDGEDRTVWGRWRADDCPEG